MGGCVLSCCMCVKKSGRRGMMSGRWCCGWHGLSIAVSSITPFLPVAGTGHLIRLRLVYYWAAARISGVPGPICLDTPALWFRHLLLYVSWQAGWLQCTPADRLDRRQQTERFMVIIGPYFCRVYTKDTPVGSLNAIYNIVFVFTCLSTEFYNISVLVQLLPADLWLKI